MHPAWWLWPLSDRWPPEIDIVETKGNQPTTAYMTVHWAGNGVVRAYPEQMDFTGDNFAESTYEGPDFTQDFHVFGVKWTPDMLIWYIDGIERHRTTEHVPQEPFMLIIDLALDNYGGGGRHLHSLSRLYARGLCAGLSPPGWSASCVFPGKAST